jgi:hypothetical protein
MHAKTDQPDKHSPLSLAFHHIILHMCLCYIYNIIFEAESFIILYLEEKGPESNPSTRMHCHATI